MVDQWGRAINYMRISVTDRCNLRCTYCMPHGVVPVPHSDVLTYEEILQICNAAVQLGIVHFKITGGEPLVRRGCAEFIAALKALPGVQTVSITTNGLLLKQYLDTLAQIPIDGINISLDAVNDACYRHITGGIYTAEDVLQQVKRCVAKGIKTKINAVLLKECAAQLPQLAAIAKELPVDVRFIELMPIGLGASMQGVCAQEALACLQQIFSDLHPVNGRRGNGPALYYSASGLQGCIGIIPAVSREFCSGCNRVRLTSTGLLKPCLCFEQGVALRPLLAQNGANLQAVMQNTIMNKPKAHCFSNKQQITESKCMNQIGG